MKKGKRVRRQIFVFTPEEKKAAACVLAAFVLGLATKHYRETHPRQPPPPTAREQHQAQRAAKSAKARARSGRGQLETSRATAGSATPVIAGVERDDEED